MRARERQRGPHGMGMTGRRERMTIKSTWVAYFMIGCHWTSTLSSSCQSILKSCVPFGSEAHPRRTGIICELSFTCPPLSRCRVTYLCMPRSRSERGNNGTDGRFQGITGSGPSAIKMQVVSKLKGSKSRNIKTRTKIRSRVKFCHPTPCIVACFHLLSIVG